MPLNLEIDENTIILSLIKEGITSQEQVDNISKSYYQNIEAKKNSLFNKIFVIDIQNRKLQILNSHEKEIEAIELPLKEKQEFNPDNWLEWGNSVVALDDENKKIGEFSWKLGTTYGIALSTEKINSSDSYVYTPNIEEQPYLIKTEKYTFGVVPKATVKGYPFDFYLSRDKSLLCITDRGAGILYLINTIENKLLKTFQVRNAGSNKCINVAISTKKKKIYLTDNQSSSFYTIDLQTLEMQTKNLTFGILGNIELDHKEECIYCVTVKPQTLKLLNIDTLALKKEFKLKGELFSISDVPSDILCSSMDRKSIYLVTHISEPNPFTPVITVINSETEKEIKRFSIKDGSKLINIGFGIENSAFSEKKTNLELMLEKNIIDMSQIEITQQKIREDETLKQVQADQEMDASKFKTAGGGVGGSQVSDDDERWKIKDKPKKIGFANINPIAETQALKKCKLFIYKEYEKQLLEIRKKKEHKGETILESEFDEMGKKFGESLDDENNMAISRLKTALASARGQLEWHDIAVVRLAKLFDWIDLELLYTREQMQDFAHEAERENLITEGMKTIPTNCPNCDAKLLGSYSCRVCGFEVDKPQDAILGKKLAQLSTIDPLENLPQGHLLLIEKGTPKIMEVDPFKNIVWEIKKDVLRQEIEIELIKPTDVIRLKNNINLIVDAGSNRVYEGTQRGKVYWEFDKNESPKHALKHPRSIAVLASRNILISDTGNHRIIEVDRNNYINWEYGQLGKEGISEGLLNTPYSCIRTGRGTTMIVDSGNHRILELDHKKIIWQYGNENNISDGGEGNGENQLNFPTAVWNFTNDNTMIIDSGNNRIIEVSPEKKIVWEFKLNATDNTKITNPYRMYMMKAGKMLVIGDDTLILLDRADKKVEWFTDLSSFAKASRVEIKVIEQEIKPAKLKFGMSKSTMHGKIPNVASSADEIIKKIEHISKGQRTNGTVLQPKDAKVSEREFIAIDKLKGELFRINRLGNVSWEYNIKTQYVHYMDERFALICDTENRKVIEVDTDNENKIIWECSEGLNSPKSAEKTIDGTVLIADRLGNKVIEIATEDNTVIWEFKGWDKLKTPYHATKLENGNILITDFGAHIILEVTPEKEVVWHYGISKIAGNEEGYLSSPEYAERLKNGNTLITDSRNARIIEVSPDNKIVWEYKGSKTQLIISPTSATRLDDGNTVIVHSGYKQIIEVDQEGNVLWKYMFK